MTPQRLACPFRLPRGIRAGWELLGLVASVVLAMPSLHACPTCKEGLGQHDAALQGAALGFSYSIYFMMAMPFVIFAGLASYFYWEIRRARKRAAFVAEASIGGAESSSSGDG